MSVSNIPATSQDVSSTNPTAGTNNSDISSLASEDTFLKLFVAQLQNQDPLNPDEQSGSQMVAELAQFSQLEQTMNIGQDVHSIAQTITNSSNSATNSPNTQGA